MAKNYIQDGSVLTLTAPAGGVNSGVAYAIGTLVVVANGDAAAGKEFAGHTGGVWNLTTATGLTAGDAVGLLAGELVAAATAGAVPCGKLVSDESDGTANLLLLNSAAVAPGAG